MKRKNNLTEWLGILCIFSVFFDKAIRGGGLAFDFYFYYPLYLLFLCAVFFKYGKLFIPPRWFNLSLIAVFLVSILVLLNNGLLGSEFIKQVIGILFSVLTYYNTLAIFKWNVKKVFDYYLQFAFLVALHGCLDNILHMAGVHLTHVNHIGGLLYREYGIMGEPFYLAMALTPAVVYYICKFKAMWMNHKFKLGIILACYLVTYSSIAVLGLVLAVFLSLYVNDYFNANRSKIILFPLLILPIALIVGFLVENVDLMNSRFNDTTNLFFASQFDIENVKGTNASTFALYSNFIISRDAITQSPLFGKGLGSHPLIYEQTFLEYFPKEFLEDYGNQNQQDANSKFFRLMSETGLLGLFLFFTFLFKFLVKKKDLITKELKEIGIINLSIFAYIILGLIRNGNYINIGFFLFFFIYYYSYKLIKREANLVNNLS